jgi:hypothetical protein
MWDFQENEVRFTWSAAFDTNTLMTHDISPFDERHDISRFDERHDISQFDERHDISQFDDRYDISPFDETHDISLFDENSCFVLIEEESDEECDDNPLVETSSSSTVEGEKKSAPARPTVTNFASRFRKSFQSLKKGLTKRINRSGTHLEIHQTNESQSISAGQRQHRARQSQEHGSKLQTHLKNKSVIRTERTNQKQPKLSSLKKKFHLGTQKPLTNKIENERPPKSQSCNSRSNSSNEEELVDTGSSESSLVMDNSVIQFSIPGRLGWC